MTIDEVSRRYRISPELLKEYEQWQLCTGENKTAGAWQYDDADIQRLSMIITLKDVGLSSDEIKEYMQPSEKENKLQRRTEILNKKRNETLEEIHLLEKKLECIDYLRCCIRCGKKNDEI
mgnify:CR=1 FL=1